MKKFLLIIIVILATATIAQAQDQVPVATLAGNSVMRPKKGKMTVELPLDLSQMDIKSNRAVLISPYITNGKDSLLLPEVAIYGRRRYLYYVRNDRNLISQTNGTTLRTKDMPDVLNYTAQTDMRSWMDGAYLKIWYQLYGCCGDVLDEKNDMLVSTGWRHYMPTLIFSRPAVDTLPKTRHLADTAYVDFIVDKTYIAPEYHNNVRELGRIRASIDSVRNDKDVTITRFFLKGFASPESPYAHNKELAIGRTEAIRQYVQRLYNFNPDIMHTDYEPENWEGLRREVERGNLEHRTEILELIDSDTEPDRKEWLIKTRYPQEYRFLLQTVYPFLRRTIYRIDYTVRSYTDVAEILRVLKTRPQNLSLNELYVAALTFKEGSQEYNDIFNLAVRLYPNDHTANLNAANIALMENNLTAAKRFLEKAGTSAQAEYARGAYHFYAEDYAAARRFMKRAANMGMKQAKEALDELENMGEE